MGWSRRFWSDQTVGDKRLMQLPPQKLLALRPNREYEIFLFDDAGATAAVGFVEKGGAIYRLDHYYHRDEILPTSTLVGRIKNGEGG